MTMQNQTGPMKMSESYRSQEPMIAMRAKRLTIAKINSNGATDRSTSLRDAAFIASSLKSISVGGLVSRVYRRFDQYHVASTEIPVQSNVTSKQVSVTSELISLG